MLLKGFYHKKNNKKNAFEIRQIQINNFFKNTF